MHGGAVFVRPPRQDPRDDCCHTAGPVVCGGGSRDTDLLLRQHCLASFVRQPACLALAQDRQSGAMLCNMLRTPSCARCCGDFSFQEERRSNWDAVCAP